MREAGQGVCEVIKHSDWLLLWQLLLHQWNVTKDWRLNISVCVFGEKKN